MKRRTLQSTLALLCGLALVLTLLLLMNKATLVRADPGVLYVAPGADCNGASPCYGSVQVAVDAAATGDEIRVAAGVYTGVQNSPGLNTDTFTATQMVVVTKSVGIRGGYSISDWNTSSPPGNPTILDAESQGRVLYITGDISVTVEGVQLKNGNATGLGSFYQGYDKGGCICIFTATATISNNLITGGYAYNGGGLFIRTSAANINGNTFLSNSAEFGGGAFLLWSDDATLDGNVIASNTADGAGGGVYLNISAATVKNNTVSSNTANTGGGIKLDRSDAMLSGNDVSHNSAYRVGGGLQVENSSATLISNTIKDNLSEGGGGGLQLDYSDATLSHNTIVSNTALEPSADIRDRILRAALDSLLSPAGGPWNGGGVGMRGSDAVLNDNVIRANAARYGGGVFLYESNASLTGNHILANDAEIDGGGGYVSWQSNATIAGNTVASNTAGFHGGGLALWENAATVTGNTVVSNTAFEGGGLYLKKVTATLSANTIASNETSYGYGGGVYLTMNRGTTVLSKNTIVSNTAWDGGGIAIRDSVSGDTEIVDNTIISNTAGQSGGGVRARSAVFTLTNNTISYNVAGKYGGGVNFYSGTLAMFDNAVEHNIADISDGGLSLLSATSSRLHRNTFNSNTAGQYSGGVGLFSSNAEMVNNAISYNTLDNGPGSGLFVWNSSPHLVHTTIAQNTGGEGSGVFVVGSANMTNTILTGHSVGISVTGGSTVTLNGVLWHDTPITISKTISDVVNVQNQYEGDPALAPDGYHLQAGSAAIDRGVDAGITVDIDGELRPVGTSYDLGADEIMRATAVEPGTDATLTYTDTQGSPTIINVPGDAVTEAITLVYIPADTPAPSAGFLFAGHAFDLDAYREGTLVAGYVFSEPINVAIHYTNADVAGLDESELKLMYWNTDTSAWEDAACGLYDRHPDDNWLAIPICHLSRFALFAEGHAVFLPLTLRSY